MPTTNTAPILVDGRGRARQPMQRESRCACGCGHKFYVGEMVVRTSHGAVSTACVTDADLRRVMDADIDTHADEIADALAGHP